MRHLNGGAALLSTGKEELDAFTDAFNEYASDKKVGLQPQEMRFDTHMVKGPLELWLKYSARVDEMLPCDHGHYYSPRSAAVYEEMERVMKNMDLGLPPFTNSSIKHQEL